MKATSFTSLSLLHTNIRVGLSEEDFDQKKANKAVKQFLSDAKDLVKHTEGLAKKLKKQLPHELKDTTDIDFFRRKILKESAKSMVDVGMRIYELEEIDVKPENKEKILSKALKIVESGEKYDSLSNRIAFEVEKTKKKGLFNR